MVRYNPWPKHTTETVAAHSYYTAMFTLMLCEELKVSSLIKATAIKIALLHDTPEMVSNDITYDAKKAIPALDKPLEEFEHSFIKSNFGDKVYEQMFDSYLEDDKVARAIVKAADVLSVIQYCDQEVQLGNKSFEPLLVDAIDRFNNEKSKLERLGLKCQKIII